MYKIQTLNKISPNGLDLFSRDNYDVAGDINSPDGILLRSFKMHDMELDPNLKAVARAGAGVNNIPIDKCTDRGIVVFNTPGANANGVKELVICSLLLASRNIISAVEWAKTLVGKGDEVPKLVEKGKSNYAGNEIAGKKLGVIGLGAIGSIVANAAEGMGMEVIGYDPFISVDAAWGLSQTVRKATSLDNLLSEVDYLTINVGLNDKTKGMINAEKFGIMKKGMRIINMARGGLIESAALKGALEDGTVVKYVTDFPDEEVLKMHENVIPIPHLGASTEESEDNCAVMAANQMIDYLEKGNIVNSVNFPACEMAMACNTRITIANKNVSGIVNKITGVLAEQNINIADMINKNRGDIAYNIIDVENDISDDTIAKLKAIEGNIMVRVIKK